MNDGSKGPKGPMKRFSANQRSVMESEFRINAYPSQRRYLYLADLLGLTQMQVCALFLKLLHVNAIIALILLQQLLLGYHMVHSKKTKR